MTLKRIYVYPLLFGILGALIGLVIRYSFISPIPFFNFKHFLHAHSHVMLLGFVFNALLIFVWDQFAKGMDKISSQYFITLQISMAIMVVTFLVQGYALFSILFSTIHLWLSYILLIRLWKRLDNRISNNLLIKIGIVFHFISSLGPYILGPLMVLGLKESPWYQQAIFFYLHFQFFGIFFVWLIALILNKLGINPNVKQISILAAGLVLTYAHSLDYSFNHWVINVLGALGSIFILLFLWTFKTAVNSISMRIKYLLVIIIAIALANFAGSFPHIGQWVVESRYMLIAWLHLLFLGMYIPFIWIFLGQKIHKMIWWVYILSIVFSELILVFPNLISQWSSLSLFWLLFLAYSGVTISILTVHIQLLSTQKK